MFIPPKIFDFRKYKHLSAQRKAFGRLSFFAPCRSTFGAIAERYRYFRQKKRELKLSDLFIVTSEIVVHFFRFLFYKSPIDLVQIREESNIPKDVQNAMVVAYEFTSIIFGLIFFHPVNYVLSKFFISHLIHLIIFFFAQKFFFTKFLDTLDSLFCKFKI